jgi:hypothetical protein
MRLLSAADRWALLRPYQNFPGVPSVEALTEREDMMVLHIAEQLETHPKVMLTGSNTDHVASHFSALGHRVSLTADGYTIYARKDKYGVCEFRKSKIGRAHV